MCLLPRPTDSPRRELTVTKVPCAQQRNASDCGVYTIVFATAICQRKAVPGAHATVDAPAWRKHLRQSLLSSSAASVPAPLLATFPQAVLPLTADVSSSVYTKSLMSMSTRIREIQKKQGFSLCVDDEASKWSAVYVVELKLVAAVAGLSRLHENYKEAIEGLEPNVAFGRDLQHCRELSRSFAEAVRGLAKRTSGASSPSLCARDFIEY